MIRRSESEEEAKEADFKERNLGKERRKEGRKEERKEGSEVRSRGR